jgi:hypothetical protein
LQGRVEAQRLRKPQRDMQARVRLAAFQLDDRLPTHPGYVGELGLRDAQLAAAFTERSAEALWCVSGWRNACA